MNTLTPDITNTILTTTNAHDIGGIERVQSLWSGYGEILRIHLQGGDVTSVILKHIKLPDRSNHPRGWNTDLSHQRKIRSYQVEAHWYQHYAKHCDRSCTVPDCLAVQTDTGETQLLLTDLDAQGFDVRKDAASIADIHACLEWLASFHSTFLGSSTTGLWEVGTYWYLDTRPDELAALDDTQLRAAAPLIDHALRDCQFQTLVHGDAKLANFCFSSASNRVAAVDFQYIGGGCGMKDVAYFLGSCLSEQECQALEAELLDYYFSSLRAHTASKQPSINVDALENEWRSMFELAWADFHRFLKGWSPGHWKLNSYSEQLSRRAIERLLPNSHR